MSEFKLRPGEHVYRPLKELTEEEETKLWEEVMAMTDEELMRIFDDPEPTQEPESKKHTPSERPN